MHESLVTIDTPSCIFYNIPTISIYCRIEKFLDDGRSLLAEYTAKGKF